MNRNFSWCRSVDEILCEEFGKTSEEGRRGQQMIRDLCTLLGPPASTKEFQSEDAEIKEHMSEVDIFNVRFLVIKISK
jgi:hypothetical protein